MSGIKGIGRRGLLASSAMLFGAMFTIMLLPAYGQQDVSPDWYDPAPNAAVVHSAQAPAVAQSSQLSVATHAHQQTARSLSPAVSAGKLHVKDAKLDQSGHSAVRNIGGVSSASLTCAEPIALHANQQGCPTGDDLAYQRVASVEGSAGLAPGEQR